jgi:ankyrin repeat protein
LLYNLALMLLAPMYGTTPLLQAVERQDAGAVSALLRGGANPNQADADGLAPLALACERASLPVIAALIRAHANPAGHDAQGVTPLHICARFTPAATASLIAHHAPINAPDQRGQIPLMWAASNGHAEAMAALLRAGADPARRDQSGFSALAFAVKSGRVEAVRLLLSPTAAAWRGPENTSLAQLAAYQSAWDVLGLLVARGLADTAALDREGQALLHRAASAGRTDLIAAILAKGAKIDALSGPTTIKWVTEANFGVAPSPMPPSPALFFAALAGRAGAMQSLIAAGANPRFVPANGQGLILAATAGQSALALQVALDQGLDPNSTDAGGNSALHHLAGGANFPDLVPMLKALAAKGGRKDLPNAKGKTPAQIAQSGRSEVRDAFAQVFP